MFLTMCFRNAFAVTVSDNQSPVRFTWKLLISRIGVDAWQPGARDDRPPKTLSLSGFALKPPGGDDPGAVEGAIIRGYSMFLAQHGHQIKKQHLVDAVKKNLTPGQLVTNAQNIREVFRGSLASNLVRSLIEIYNRGLRTGKIEVTE